MSEDNSRRCGPSNRITLPNRAFAVRPWPARLSNPETDRVVRRRPFAPPRGPSRLQLVSLENVPDQAHQALVADDPPRQGEQDLVVDRGKVLPHVAFECAGARVPLAERAE